MLIKNGKSKLKVDYWRRADRRRRSHKVVLRKVRTPWAGCSLTARWR